MSWYSNYVSNMAKDAKSFYEEFVQETIDSEFDDSTLVRTIQEEKYPFHEEYEPYEVQIDSVAEVTVNIIKVIGDFISVLFRDCSHKNLRGQKYIYNGETYLCYDKINELSSVARTRLIRCNNEISWLNDKGKILTEKVFLGYELSSTNDSVGKDGIVSNRRLVLYVQNNEKTKDIKINQRFMFQHNQCFKVEEIDNYNRESGTNNDVTLMRLNLVYSTALPNDNKELNVCDYYNNIYKLTIDQEDIQQIKGFSSTLYATLLKNNEIVENAEFIWKSANEKVVSIDEESGAYTIVGDVGQQTEVICYYKENISEIFDSITFSVVDDYLPEHKLIVSPNTTKLKEEETINFICKVYVEGEEQVATVSCIPSGVSEDHYELLATIDGFSLKNKKYSNNKLHLVFSSNNCDDVIMDIELDGLF